MVILPDDAARPRRQFPAMTRRDKYSFALPGSLRVALERASSARGRRPSLIVAEALTWFVRYWRNAGDVPALTLMTPEHLPVPTASFPPTFAVSLHESLIFSIDEIVASGRAGANRSAVVRYALCAFFEDAAFARPRGEPLRVPSRDGRVFRYEIPEE